MPSPWSTDKIDTLTLGPNAAGQSIYLTDAGAVANAPEIDLYPVAGGLPAALRTSVAGPQNTLRVQGPPSPGYVAASGSDYSASGPTGPSASATTYASEGTNGLGELYVEADSGQGQAQILSGFNGGQFATISATSTATTSEIDLTATTVKVNGVAIGGSSAVASGAASFTVAGGAGNITIPHGLGHTPTIVHVWPTAPGNAVLTTAVAPDATNIYAKMWSSFTALCTNGTVINCRWDAQ